MNLTLILLLVIPAVLFGVSLFAIPAINPQITNKDSAKISGIVFAFAAVFVVGMYYVGKGVQTDDVQVLNGMITGKTKVEGSYTRTYSCNCRNVCTGSGNNQSCSQSCDTCTEEHYTVRWDAQTSIMNKSIRIWDVDSTSMAVYMTPDPALYTHAASGQPCAISDHYTNYIKAVPESLFKPKGDELRKRFSYMLPSYPSEFYGLWNLDRVINAGFRMPDLQAWNAKLSDTLRTLGNDKQANVIIVFAATADPNYAYALQDAWIGGKKNDIVLVIGVNDYPKKAAWANVMALTDSEEFKVKLRDDVLALDSLTPDGVIGTIDKDTRQYYKRKRMHDYEYLDAEISPPSWMIWLTVICVIGMYIFTWWRCSKTRSFNRRRIY